MKRILMVTMAAVLAGFTQHNAPSGGVVVESESPAIGQDLKLKESIGIETLGGVFTVLLKQGVAVPCQKSEIFSTASDNQDKIMIMLYRGTAQMARDNFKIGDFQIQNIPQAPRGVPKIQVSFRVTTTDIILEAKDLSSGATMKIVAIKNERPLSISQLINEPLRKSPTTRRGI